MKQDLLEYCEKTNIKSGPIFSDKDGTVLENAYITRKLKKLVDEAELDKNMISLHSFRNLFLQNRFEEMEKEKNGNKDEEVEEDEI